ncbi:hypothetical protein P5673_000342 [Acropora cervicornis]|uniref:Uncharacterized protein n=1 Tax=Acropora cervicornis TaxID=6130 RepID=A0AAD9VHN4_ACRCE|nr:hypothetical protein P5673_000342 [Acropora cervicornis]
MAGNPPSAAYTTQNVRSGEFCGNQFTIQKDPRKFGAKLPNQQIGKKEKTREHTMVTNNKSLALLTVIVLRWKKGLVTAMQRSTAIDIARKAE